MYSYNVYNVMLSILSIYFAPQLRRPIGTAFEIILPALALLVIVGLRYNI